MVWYTSSKVVSGVTRPSWIAPAIVMTLLAEPVVVGAHEADHRPRDGAVRVEAARFVLVRDPDQAQLAHVARHLVVDLARDIGERALAVRQALLELRLVDLHDGGELGRIGD